MAKLMLSREGHKEAHERRVSLLEELTPAERDAIRDAQVRCMGLFVYMGEQSALELLEALGVFLADPQRRIRTQIQRDGKNGEKSGI